MSAIDADAAFSEVQLADGPIGFTIGDQHGQVHERKRHGAKIGVMLTPGTVPGH